MPTKDDASEWKQKAAFYKEILDVIVSQNKGTVWKYDIKKRCAQLIEGKHVFFKQGGILQNVPEELLARGLIHADSQEQFLTMYEHIFKGSRLEKCMIRVREEDNEYHWQTILHHVFSDENGEPDYAIAYAVEIAVPIDTERQYFQEEHLRTMLSEDVIASSKVNLSRNRIDYIWAANMTPDMVAQIKAYEQMFQVGLKGISNAEDRNRYKKMFGYEKLLAGVDQRNTNLSMDCRYKTPLGKIIWVVMEATIILDPQSHDVMYYSFIRNIDEKKKLELMLREKAECDQVTGLYNKATTESLIQEALQQNRSDGQKCALLILDVDNFKQANDQYGHPFGDYILKQLGRLMKNTFKTSTILGRVGGDEFAVYVNSVTSEAQIIKKVEAIIDAMKTVEGEKQNSAVLTISVGVTFASGREINFDELYEQADIALYDAKAQGKNRYTVYSQQSRVVPDNFSRSFCLAKAELGSFCMMEELDEMAFVIDPANYKVLYMNHSAKQAFPDVNFKNELPKCYEVIHGFTHPCPFCMDHTVEADKFNSWYNVNQKLNRHFIIKDKLMYKGGHPYRFEMFFDVEELRHADQSLPNDILFQSIEILISINDLPSALNQVLRKIGEFYHSERAYIVEFSSNVSAGSVTFEWNAAESMNRPAVSRDRDPIMREWWMKKLKNGTPVFINDLDEIPEKVERKMLEMQSVHSIYVIPFKSQDTLQGYIRIDNASQNMGVISILSQLAFLVGVEISRYRMRETQNYIDSYDPLTGLLNRNSYGKHTQKLPLDALSSLGVMSADVNGLKAINQQFGHAYGDCLIKYIGTVLQEVFQDSEVFRFSGDEFLVLCQDRTYEAFQRMVTEAQKEVEQQYPGALAYGYTWADSDIDIERMLQHTEELMIVSKREYYVNKNNDNLHVHPYVLDELLLALSQNRYVLYLQPKIDISTGKVGGAEALVRYVNPDGDIVGPGEFVPILERQHYIHYIDLFIFEEVCKMLQNWMQKGYVMFPVSVNFSRSTLLESHIIQEMNRISDKYSVPRKYLEIEITESFGDVELETLKQVGNMIAENHYGLSLDDFGAKYSNIAVLSMLKLNTLKLDKILMKSLYSHQSLKIIVKNIIIICHQINIKCVAEGVETQEQLQVLKELECDYAQGYLYNKPIPAARFENIYMK